MEKKAARAVETRNPSYTAEAKNIIYCYQCVVEILVSGPETRPGSIVSRVRERARS